MRAADAVLPAPPLGRLPDGLDRLRRRRGGILVLEADDRSEAPADHLGDEEEDVDARVGERASDGGPEAGAIVALHQHARTFEDGEPRRLGRGGRLLPGHRIELDRGTGRGLRKAVPYDQAEIRPRLRQRLERSGQHVGLVLDLSAPERDSFHGECHGRLLAPEVARPGGERKTGSSPASARAGVLTPWASRGTKTRPMAKSRAL